MSKKCIKRKHDSRGKAKYEANRLAVRYGVPYSFFICQHCGKWHTGRTYANMVEPSRRLFLKNNSAVIGIDPGNNGALAMICASKIEVYDFKDVLSSFDLVCLLNEKFRISFAIIEKVWIWPNEKDVKSAEVLIRNAQMWDTILAINKIPFETYTPAAWRKGLVEKSQRTKKGYIEKAISLFPKYEHLFTSHDRAEATLIAYRAFKHVEAGMPVRS